MNTVFLHVPPVFRSSVPKVYRTSNSVRSPEKENNVEKRTARRRGGGGGKRRDFAGYAYWNLTARKKEKNGNCEVENWSGRARLRAIVP